MDEGKGGRKHGRKEGITLQVEVTFSMFFLHPNIWCSSSLWTMLKVVFEERTARYRTHTLQQLSTVRMLAAFKLDSQLEETYIPQQLYEYI